MSLNKSNMKAVSNDLLDKVSGGTHFQSLYPELDPGFVFCPICNKQVPDCTNANGEKYCPECNAIFGTATMV